MIDANKLLDRIELLAIRNDQTSQRNVSLMVERDKWHNDHDAIKRELGLERTKREQAESLVVQGDFKMATLRIDLRTAEKHRDEVRQAVKAMFDVPPTQRRKVMAARSVLAALMGRLDAELEIPF